MDAVQPIFTIQKINRHRMYIDGVGINTLVGLYGCPLKCKYCINKNMLATPRFKKITPKELVDKVLIDYCYFKATGGGVTFGGGESLLYSDAIRAFREVLPKDIPIKVETSLNVPSVHLTELLGVVDEYIIDIKTMNSKIYREYTGLNNQKVLENLALLCSHNMQEKCKIRIPNIPGFTTQSDIDEAVSVIKDMGFNKLDIFNYVIKEEEEKL